MDKKSMEIYKNLEAEMAKPNPNMGKLLFLTGAVQALRAVNNFQVPEIELAFLKIRKVYGKEIESCL